MAASLPTSLPDALDLPLSFSSEVTVQLSPDPAMASVSVGGYVASAMAKYALYYASKHPKMQNQIDLYSTVHQFYRPIFIGTPVKMTLREVSIGKGWSTLRVEAFQTDKLAASADLVVTNLSNGGITLKTGWHLPNNPVPVDLAKLGTDTDPNWVSYHCAFYPDGFRRGHSYAKSFIPRVQPTEISFVEQWVEPGWDSLPQGSRPLTAGDNKARWTNEMIPFVVDMTLPIQENFFPREKGRSLPVGSIAATLGYAARQQQAREEGRDDWRVIGDDGSKRFGARILHVSLSLSTEIKQRLAPEGVRWLCLRSECKRVLNGRMDLEVLVFDERMDLIAISHQTAVLIEGTSKMQKL